tara:strand:+ start:353 stop:1030 length:678 start_codon:yes stop_codon:yes gene_type:complete
MTIYYGNGEVEIDSTDVKVCQITIRYPIEIDDKTPYEYEILVPPHATNKIIISLLRGKSKNNLKTLFNYEGQLEIISATVANNNGDKENCIIKRVMDYSELLNTNAEDMTNKSEDLKATSIYKRTVSKTKVLNPIIGNLKSIPKEFYLADGSEYIGDYHVHRDTMQRMAGAVHTEDSQELYFKEEYAGKVIDKLILSNSNNYANTTERKIRKRKSHVMPRRRQKK